MNLLKLWSRPNLVPSRPRRFPMSHHLSSFCQACRGTRVIAVVSKPPPLTRRARIGVGTRLVKTASPPSAEAQMGTARVSAGEKIGWYRFIIFPVKEPEDRVHWV